MFKISNSGSSDYSLDFEDFNLNPSTLNTSFANYTDEIFLDEVNIYYDFKSSLGYQVSFNFL